MEKDPDETLYIFSNEKATPQTQTCTTMPLHASDFSSITGNGPANGFAASKDSVITY